MVIFFLFQPKSTIGNLAMTLAVTAAIPVPFIHCCSKIWFNGLPAMHNFYWHEPGFGFSLVHLINGYFCSNCCQIWFQNFNKFFVTVVVYYMTGIHILYCIQLNIYNLSHIKMMPVDQEIQMGSQWPGVRPDPVHLDLQVRTGSTYSTTRSG